MALLEQYADLLATAAGEQNLVSRSTLANLWDRHIVDSAQLVRFEPRHGAHWADVGSGAGLPGLVIAALVQGPVTLIEPRRLRSDFLADCVVRLGLGARVEVVRSKVERVAGPFDVITGRAVAPLGRFIDLSHHLSTKNTVWVLPKGRDAQSQLEAARARWHCHVRTETSCTDPQSAILVLQGVGKSKR